MPAQFILGVDDQVSTLELVAPTGVVALRLLDLQSFVREVIATGERQNEFGEKPSGYISYQPDGRMFAVLVGDNRTSPAGAVPTDEEKTKLFGTLIAYSGS